MTRKRKGGKPRLSSEGTTVNISVTVLPSQAKWLRGRPEGISATIRMLVSRAMWSDPLHLTRDSKGG